MSCFGVFKKYKKFQKLKTYLRHYVRNFSYVKNRLTSESTNCVKIAFCNCLKIEKSSLSLVFKRLLESTLYYALENITFLKYLCIVFINIF